MNLLTKLWQAIKAFFSPTKEDWDHFYRRGRNDGSYGSGGYDTGGSYDADCGDGGGGDGGGGD
jgi:hypothetical protein